MVGNSAAHWRGVLVRTKKNPLSTLIVSYKDRKIYIPDGTPLIRLKAITRGFKGNWKIYLIAEERGDMREYGDVSRVEVSDVYEPIGFKNEKTIL